MIDTLVPWSEELAARLGETTASQPPQIRSRARRWAGLAAAATVTLALGLTYLLQPVGDPGTSTETVRSAALPGVLPASGSVHDAPPAELTWPALTGASSYLVQLFDGTGELSWESGSLEDNRLLLPEELKAGLGAGQAYYWVVRTSGQARQQEVGPFWFEIRR